MTSQPTNTLTILCPGCGARFQVPASAIGRRGRCAKCGVVIVIAAGSGEAASRPVSGAPGTSGGTPEYIGFECRVCQTRMHERPERVGHKVKCPDCGASNVVPPPPKAKVKRPPAALEGDQYELWDADQQPLPSQLIAEQPVYISVVCRLCGTLMYATADQVGQTIACPDCRTPHVVPTPPAPAQQESPLDLEGAYDVDASADPGERPPVIHPEMHRRIYEEEQGEEFEAPASGAAGRRKKRGRKTDARGRPIMPRWPLVTGIISFLFSRGVPVRWLALSVLLLFGGSITSFSFSTLGGTAGAAAGMGAIAGVSFMVIAAIVGVIWAAAAANICLTIITESSEGNDQIQYWVMSPIEWFSSLIYPAIALPISALPGWLIAQLATDDPGQRALWVAGSMWLCLPVVLLSQLAVSSPWAVISGQLLQGLVRRPFSSLLFYAETAALVGGCVAATAAVAAVNSDLALLLAPACVAAGLAYCRLLGRVAWRVAETGDRPGRS